MNSPHKKITGEVILSSSNRKPIMPECPGALQYAQMRDGHMIRLRFPGGQVSSSQLQCLATLSQRYGNGLLDLTNRANLQIRGIQSVPENQLASLLQKENILAKALWADRLRNIMADPLREKAENGLINTSSLVRELDSLLQQTPALKDISAKFCFVIDNGSSTHIAAQPHDLALRAYKKDNAVRYALSIANSPTALSVDPLEAAPLLIAIAKYICRTLPKIKRGADMVRRLGQKKMVSEIQQFFPSCREETNTPQHVLATLPPIGLISQHAPTLTSVGLGIPVSRLTAKQISALGHWAQHYGNGSVMLSPWQIIYITDIATQDGAKVCRLGEQHGFVTSPAFLHTQVYACSGSSGCPRTETSSKEDGFALTKKLMVHSSQSLLSSPVKIHLSGCERGCAFARTADILALAETDGSGYRLHNHKAMSDIRHQPPPKNQPLHPDIVEAVITQLKTGDKV